MKIRTGTDAELRTLLREEMQTLQRYVEMFDDITAEEKDELREWMAHGNSVNSNPHMLYGENGCLMDFINASRIAEDIAAYPEQYLCTEKKVTIPNGFKTQICHFDISTLANEAITVQRKNRITQMLTTHTLPL